MKHHHSVLKLLALQSILVCTLLYLYSDRNIETAEYIDYDIPYSLRQSITADLSDTKPSILHANNNNYYTIPNLLLIGAQKAGTTSLAQWMFDSGDVCSAKVFPNEPDFYNKETHFFNEQKRYELYLGPIFEQYNEELYQFLEDNQYTFPRFEKIAIERG